MNVTMAIRFRMSVVMALAMVAGACGSQSMTPDSRSSAGPSSGLERGRSQSVAVRARPFGRAASLRGDRHRCPDGSRAGPSTGSSEPPTSTAPTTPEPTRPVISSMVWSKTDGGTGLGVVTDDPYQGQHATVFGNLFVLTGGLYEEDRPAIWTSRDGLQWDLASVEGADQVGASTTFRRDPREASQSVGCTGKTTTCCGGRPMPRSGPSFTIRASRQAAHTASPQSVTLSSPSLPTVFSCHPTVAIGRNRRARRPRMWPPQENCLPAR